jgi:hypothetical protein
VFKCIIIYHWNGWHEFTTDQPWDFIKAHMSEVDIHDWKEIAHAFHPWTTRFMDTAGDIFIITMPEGTLD